ncbi:hypothetical protein ABTX77_36450 [Streptomyces sp. NPDC097704]|uniref:hypothetical protein n=1 Tax=Streptomyces sp. NPDC097704 TaxID=3157101 RepID=UPI00332B404B
MTTPYGVASCRCSVDIVPPRFSDNPDNWTANPHCPYHGILPRDRAGTGIYRVVTDYELAHRIDDAPACTCGNAGACYVPAGHYRDCPQYDVSAALAVEEAEAAAIYPDTDEEEAACRTSSASPHGQKSPGFLTRVRKLLRRT